MLIKFELTDSRFVSLDGDNSWFVLCCLFSDELFRMLSSFFLSGLLATLALLAPLSGEVGGRPVLRGVDVDRF